MKNLVPILAPALVIVSLTCGKPPEPGKPVAFNEACTDKYKPEIIRGATVGPRISTSGYASLSKLFSMVSDTIMVMFHETPDRKGPSIQVSLRYNKGKNSLEKLPKKYTEQDMKIKTAKGEILGINDKITVHGERGGMHAKECYIRVNLIEKG